MLGIKGNAANAAVVGEAAARKAQAKRALMFRKAQPFVAEARVVAIRPLNIDNYAIVFGPGYGVALGKGAHYD